MKHVSADKNPMSMTEIANLKHCDWAKFHEPLRSVQINQAPRVFPPRSYWNKYSDDWAIYLTYYNGRGGTSPVTFYFDHEDAVDYLCSLNPNM